MCYAINLSRPVIGGRQPIVVQKASVQSSPPFPVAVGTQSKYDRTKIRFSLNWNIDRHPS